MDSHDKPFLLGIHHITALSRDPKQTIDFYARFLGLRLVKQTVNFDAPDVYHLYFGDTIGTPGTVLTFFPFPDAARGSRGTGELGAVILRVPENSYDFWVDRLARADIDFRNSQYTGAENTLSFSDPDGLRLELVFENQPMEGEPWLDPTIPPDHAIRSIAGAIMVLREPTSTYEFLEHTLSFHSAEISEGRQRYEVGEPRSRATIDVVHEPTIPQARPGAGSIHHIAWRVPTEDAQRLWQERLSAAGVKVTAVADRQYFRSIYFREPGGVLFEIATDGPGFLVDERHQELGTSLRLPPWLESERVRIEQRLPKLVLVRPTATGTHKAF